MARIFHYLFTSFVRRTDSGNGRHPIGAKIVAARERSFAHGGTATVARNRKRTNGEDDAAWLCPREKQSL